MVDRLVAVNDADYRLPDPVLLALSNDLGDTGSSVGAGVSANVDAALADVADNPIAPGAVALAAEIAAQAAAADTQVKSARPQREPDVEWVLVAASGHGWTNVTTSTYTMEASGSPVSQNFLRFTTSVGTPTGYIQKTGLALNLTRKSLRLWVRLGIASAHTLKLKAGVSGMASYYEWTIQKSTVGVSEQILKPNEWVPVTLTFADAAIVGTPNRAAIDTLQLQTTTVAGSTGTVDLAGIAAINQVYGGVVSITFDDGYAPIASTVLPITNARSLKCTAYVIPSEVGGTGFMNLSSLHSLQSAGWDVATHHLDDLSVLSDDNLESTLRTAKAWMVANEFRGADHFAYPMGRFNPAQIAIWERYFASCRTTAQGQETIRPAMPLRLRTFYIFMSTTVADVKAAIDKCKAEGSWLILCLHNIITTPTAETTHYSIANFTDICDYLVAQKMQVLTVSEAVRRVGL